MKPRHLWLMDRIMECLTNLASLREANDWHQFRKQSLELANELQYAATEWEKYYPDDQSFMKYDVETIPLQSEK